MRKIRLGMFETNSSSVHSLSVNKRNLNPTQEERAKERKELTEEIQSHINKDNMFVIESNTDLEFGWEVEVYSDFYNKACYVIAALRGEAENIILPIIREFCPDCEGIEYPEGDSCFMQKGEEYYYGYIDHQSQGMIQEEAETYGYYDILCDKNITINTDNDNRY